VYPQALTICLGTYHLMRRRPGCVARLGGLQLVGQTDLDGFWWIQVMSLADLRKLTGLGV
jgi:hypothetical protein